MEEASYRTSRMFRVLGNPLAYRMIVMLREGPAHPGTLAVRLSRPPQTIARLGRELKLVDLISYANSAATDGRPGVEYRLKDQTLEPILDAAEAYIHKMGNLV